MNFRYFSGLEEDYNLVPGEHYECAGLIIVNGAIMVTLFIPSEIKWIICDIRHFAPASYQGAAPAMPKTSTDTVENDAIQPKE